MDNEQDSIESRDNQPHVLWKQLAGLVFWVSLFSFFAAGIIGVAAGLVLGGLTFADAWLAGIHKDKERKSFLNISPMGWGIVVPLLLIVGFPAYALSRNKLKTSPGNSVLFGLVIAIGSVVLASWVYSMYQLSING